MIDVSEVVLDGDMVAPEVFTVRRSVGSWVAGGFVSTTSSIVMTGPVHQASDKELSMMPEADRIGEARSFWSTQPIYLTSGSKTGQSLVHTETLTGQTTTTLNLSSAPPTPAVILTKNGLRIIPGTDYTVLGSVVTLMQAAVSSDMFIIQWFTTSSTPGTSASDIIVYDGQQYRVLQQYRVSGSGYWKAIAVRMAAA